MPLCLDEMYEGETVYLSNRGKNVSRFRTDTVLYGRRWITVGLKA